MTIPAKPWDYIESLFKDDPEMLSLVQHIKTSNLTSRLYAFTSLDKLIISIYNPLEMDREALHVDFKKHSEEWNFAYYAMPYKAPEFVRTYERGKGIEKFDSFIKMINW